MSNSLRQWSIAVLFLLAIARVCAAQDLSPTSFLEQATAPASAAAAAIAAGFKSSVELRSEYNSNVLLTDGGSIPSGLPGSSDRKSDFSFDASLNLSGAWSLTHNAQFVLNISVGYEEYLYHSDLSGISTNLPIQFNYTFYTGDVKWTVNEGLSVTNDPSQEPELSGVSKFGQIVNSASVDAAWAAGSRITLTLGYARVDTIYTSSTQIDSVDGSNSSSGLSNQASDTLNAALIYALNSASQLGLGASLTDTRVQGDSGNNSQSFSLGPFFKSTLTPATSATVSGGLQTSGSNGGSIGWYGDLGLSNKLNEIYSQSLDISHTTSPGIISQDLTLDQIQYTGNLILRRDITLSLNALLEHGDESGGNIREKFYTYGGGLTVQKQISRFISASLGWQYLGKASDSAGRSYKQERVFASLDWAF